MGRKIESASLLRGGLGAGWLHDWADVGFLVLKVEEFD